MMVVTGAAGFIGSCLISRLNAENFNYVIAVDDFSRADKNKNLEGKKIQEQVDRENFFGWLEKNHSLVEFIFHLGARTDTTEFNKDIFDRLNVSYSKKIWEACCKYQIPLIYASSAATYGSGTLGYKDDQDLIPALKPLNPYGVSKNDFDIWALQQENKPFFWAGLKFFNVYGPNEYHKGRMASVIFHSYNQIRQSGKIRLFRSHKPEFKDGEQMRDFVYVKDVTDVISFLMHSRKKSGIYNLGSGKARSFRDLGLGTFKALAINPEIEYIDIPADIRNTYQYFTEAPMDKLCAAGYNKPFTSLEDGIEDYVRNYLTDNKYL
jgi:ADP-L-glycero-D-manno-heptose 6-epimerase